ncbi:SDR family oxidoreductase [Pendulispora brunnea]|uniref:SDR family oxidoreductase n=1 Tax=Pendulispora brunnea TaxID=2905690 RepID=A0ABZ2K2I7_9BACT
MDLTNRTVVVLGGGSGIGLGIARAALANGARIVLGGRTREKLDRALESLDAKERGRCISVDITREADVVRLFESVPDVDHVVVTAAVLAYQPIREFDMEAARRTIDSKIVAALLIAKHGGARLRPGGSITFTTGVATDRPSPGGAVVGAVNGAIDCFIRGAASELAPIRVNALSPGWVDTELWDTMGTDKASRFAAMAQRLPTGRIGTPDDLGHAAVFLMTNGFTTGTVLHVDGGHRFV